MATAISKKIRDQFGCTCDDQGSCPGCMVISIIHQKMGIEGVKFLASKLQDPLGEPEPTDKNITTDRVTHPDEMGAPVDGDINDPRNQGDDPGKPMIPLTKEQETLAKAELAKIKKVKDAKTIKPEDHPDNPDNMAPEEEGSAIVSPGGGLIEE